MAYRGSSYYVSRQQLRLFDLAPFPTFPPVGAPVYLPYWASISSNEPTVLFTGMTELNDVQQGYDFFNRTGSKICMTNLQVRFELNSGSDASLRYAIVYDSQCNGVFPAITDIFVAPVLRIGYQSYFGISTGDVNVSNIRRFVVLCDKTVSLCTGTCLQKFVSESIDLPQLEATFDSSGGTIGDITTGSIYLIAGAASQLSARSISMGNIYARIRFFD